MPQASDPSLPARLRDRAAIDSALRDGTQAALLRHKVAGVPIVVWQDGKMVTIEADQITATTAPQKR